MFVGLAVLSVRRGSLGRRAGIGWILLWLAAAVAIQRPELTVVVARFLGIDRGADLVFYLAILAMFAGFFVVLVRIRRLDQTLTEVVRQVALQTPSASHPSESDPGDA